MEEVKSFSLFLSFNHFFCKSIILFHDLGDILLADRIFLRISRNYRLYRNLFESKICQMKHILGEIKIMVGKSTSYIILVLISGFCKLLELRHDQVIASCTFSEWTHVIMYFLTSVHTEYNVAHLFIAEFHYFIIQKNSVCC